MAGGPTEMAGGPFAEGSAEMAGLLAAGVKPVAIGPAAGTGDVGLLAKGSAAMAGLLVPGVPVATGPAAGNGRAVEAGPAGRGKGLTAHVGAIGFGGGSKEGVAVLGRAGGEVGGGAAGGGNAGGTAGPAAAERPTFGAAAWAADGAAFAWGEVAGNALNEATTENSQLHPGCMLAKGGQGLI